MKAVSHFVVGLIAAGSLTASSYAGPEQISKEVAAMAAPVCDWSGFYLGGNAGGQFGHSEDKDLNNYNFPDRPWGYSESGFSGGGQIGYNWQWHRLVFGPEIDGGYIEIDGRGIEPGFPRDTFGKSDSDFFATFRGRIGVAFNCWMLYGTGGGIGVNERLSVVDNSFTIAGPDTLNASRQDFDFGYTFGGGVERMFNFWGRRWSLKVEYLYFNLGNETFHGVSGNGFGPYGWRADTEGHIVRGGLNFHF